jgi:hypothetical protein
MVGSMQGSQNPAIDPVSMRALTQLADTYKTLKSIRCQLMTRATLGDKEEVSTGTLLIQRPGSISIRTESNRTVTIAVNHGNERMTRVAGATRRMRGEPNIKGLKAGLDASHAFVTPIFPLLVTTSDAAGKIIPGTLLRAGQGTPTSLDGVRCDVYAYEARSPYGIARFVLTIGQRDSLLRKLDLSTPGPSGQLSLSETYSRIRIDEPIEASEFIEALRGR